MGELLTSEEVSRILGIRAQSLAVWRLHKRELPFIHVGRLVRYRRSDIEAWLEAQTVSVGEG